MNGLGSAIAVGIFRFSETSDDATRCGALSATTSAWRSACGPPEREDWLQSLGHRALVPNFDLGLRH